MDLFSDNSKIDGRDLFSDSQIASRKKDTLIELETEITSETETAQYQEVLQIVTQEPVLLVEARTDPETETEKIPEILTELTQIVTMDYPDMEKSVPQETEGILIQTEEPEIKSEIQIITVTEIQRVEEQEKEKLEPETIPPQLIEAVLEIRENLVQLREGVLSGEESTAETIEIETEGTTETEISLSDIKESMELGFLDLQTGIDIIAKDQQIIGKVSIASQLVLIGIFVIFLFFGRIR